MNVPYAGIPFRDPGVTVGGQARACVPFRRLETLWINTGSLCNIACPRCYMESSPRNKRLAYISAAEARGFLDEITSRGLATAVVGFTGGEPFMNPDLGRMLTDTLDRGLSALVLTNAMAPLRRARGWLPDLAAAHPGRLRLRVSMDHYAADLHDGERGAGAWAQVLEGLRWLQDAGIDTDIAARRFCGKSEDAIRAGFATLFALGGFAIDAFDPARLVVFPEMDEAAPVPEISVGCWDVLGKSSDEMMCATSRMVIKRPGEPPAVVACTLLPYDRRFELGATLAEAERTVAMNHPHCARFCALGGGSCRR